MSRTMQHGGRLIDEETIQWLFEAAMDRFFGAETDHKGHWVDTFDMDPRMNSQRCFYQHHILFHEVEEVLVTSYNKVPI